MKVWFTLEECGYKHHLNCTETEEEILNQFTDKKRWTQFEPTPDWQICAGGKERTRINLTNSNGNANCIVVHSVGLPNGDILDSYFRERRPNELHRKP